MVLEYAIVVWSDAHADGDSWQEFTATDQAPCLVTSAGFVLPKRRGGKPKHLTLAQSVIGDEYVGSLLHIPRSMVRRKFVIGRIHVNGNSTEVE